MRILKSSIYIHMCAIGYIISIYRVTAHVKLDLWRKKNQYQSTDADSFINTTSILHVHLLLLPETQQAFCLTFSHHVFGKGTLIHYYIHTCMRCMLFVLSEIKKFHPKIFVIYYFRLKLLAFLFFYYLFSNGSCTIGILGRDRSNLLRLLSFCLFLRQVFDTRQTWCM